MTLRGTLDEIFPTLKGWVFDSDDPEPVSLRVIINEQEVGIVSCSNFRRDLQLAGIERPHSGFEFRLPKFSREMNATIRLVNSKSGDCFAEIPEVPVGDSNYFREQIAYSIDQFDWTIRGWLKDIQDELVQPKIVLYINGIRYSELKRTVLRPDVGDQRSISGFEFTLPSGEFNYEAVSAELRLEFDPDDSVVLGARVLQRTFRVPSELPAKNELRVTGGFPEHGNVVLLVRFDESSELSRGLIKRIGDLATYGYQTVICDAMTSGDQTRNQAHSRWVERVDGLSGVVERPNLGWDFGAWFHTMKFSGLLDSEVERLLLTNDSILPFGDCSKIFTRLHQTQNQLSSLTESFQHAYHLQSFFLHFNLGDNLRSLLRSFIADFDYPSKRREVIEGGELGLTKRLASDGVRLGALFPYDELVQNFLNKFEERVAQARAKAGFSSDSLVDDVEISLRSTRASLLRGENVNPTHSLWREIIELGSGFIKRDLISKNPTNQLLDLVDLSEVELFHLELLRDDCRFYRMSTPVFAL